MSHDEIAKAKAAARQVIAHQKVSVSNATVIARPGRVKQSPTGHSCTSGRELQIKLIGKFPHAFVTGHFMPPGSPAPDFTVRAMIITADAESGLVCLVVSQTGENGAPKPWAGGTTLPLT